MWTKLFWKSSYCFAPQAPTSLFWTEMSYSTVVSGGTGPLAIGSTVNVVG